MRGDLEVKTDGVEFGLSLPDRWLDQIELVGLLTTQPPGVGVA